jgi:UDP-N-acetylmuramoylalanine--D-glutamate ligase
MQPVQEQELKTLIVGLGVTGLSCARYLAAKGQPFAVTDSRDLPPCLPELSSEIPDAPVFAGGFLPEAFAAADRILVSPGVSLREPLIQEAAKRGVEILGDIELFAREAKAPVVAISGSNGKSTVTSLLGEMARIAGVKVAVGGNLGQPALDLLADDVQLYILELSSFQLETTRSLHPEAAVVLNISPDHMDRYLDLDEYLAAKALIYQGTKWAVLNRDDPRVMSIAPDSEQTLAFTLGLPAQDDFGICEYEASRWFCRGNNPLLPVSELQIPGRHNQANALATLALGTAVNLPLQAMLSALRVFRGLPHRTQFLTEKCKLRWYNDSKGTNVGSMLAALRGLHSAEEECRTVLIAGGVCKEADFSALGPVVEETARGVVLIGRDAAMIEAALPKTVPLAHAGSIEEAVELAVEMGEAGDRVLLSPGCASFDMFANFEARGEAFILAVEALRE